MFKITTKPTYKRNVKVDVPMDMGRTERHSFILELKRLSVTETKELVEEAQNKEVTDDEMIRRYAVGWEGVSDENGEPLDFNTANLEAVMDIPYVRKAIMAAFIEDVFGKEAARKN